MFMCKIRITLLALAHVFLNAALQEAKYLNNEESQSKHISYTYVNRN